MRCFLGQTKIGSKRKLYESNNEQQVTTDDEVRVHGSPANLEKREKKAVKTANKEKRGKISVQEELLEIQRVQLKAFQDAEQLNQEFYQNLVEQQRKDDAKEREKDREFFMNIAKLFSNNKN